MKLFITVFYEPVLNFCGIRFNVVSFISVFIKLFILNLLSLAKSLSGLFILMKIRPRWRHRKTHRASSQNQKKDNNKFKNKKQPELTENQTVWKSDNQGVKEETFIQTGRRGGDGQPGREDSWQGSGWRTGRGNGLQTGQSYICMQINWEEQLGSETDLTTQGSSAGK